MYILTVVPIVAIRRYNSDQFLHYFSKEKVRSGEIVEIQLQNRATLAVVFRCRPADHSRMEIRKSSYALKKISSVVSKHPIFSKEMLTFAEYLSDYYFTSLGLVLRRMIPRNKKFLGELPERKRSAKQTLTLVPEQALLPYYQEKLKGVAFHSNLTPKEQREIWKKIYEGAACNIIGTRAAFMLPFQNLKKITIENAESISHASWDQNPHIDTRRMSLYFKKTRKTNIIFHTQNPILEFPEEIQDKISKKTQKASGILVDMRKELREKNFSILSRALKDILNNMKGSQMILFINRRGFSSGILCRDCGYVYFCKHCKVPLVYHKPQLVCHHCSAKYLPESECPECRGVRIKYMGKGTKRVEEEIKKLYPSFRVVRLDSDNTPTSEKQSEALSDFKKGKYDILIGTQLILKPKLIPDVDYTGIITIDPLINLPDFRVSERVYYTIYFLRQHAKKQFTLQTYHPENPLFEWALQNKWSTFAKHEKEMRNMLNWPPYSHIIKLTHTNKNEREAEKIAQSLKSILEEKLNNLDQPNVKILGPAPSFVPKVNNAYTWYIVIKWPIARTGPKNLHLRNRLLGSVPKEWKIDVDPVDMV